MQCAEMNKASYISSTDILEVPEKFLKVLKKLQLYQSHKSTEKNRAHVASWCVHNGIVQWLIHLFPVARLLLCYSYIQMLEFLKLCIFLCFVQSDGSPCQVYSSHMVVVLAFSTIRVIKM